jgi:hypothetical protein
MWEMTSEIGVGKATDYGLEYYPTNPPRPIAIWFGFPDENGRIVANLRDASPTMAEARTMVAALNEQKKTTDTVEIVRRRLADGRTIADSDVHRLVAEVDRLRASNASLRASLDNCTHALRGSYDAR